MFSEGRRDDITHQVRIPLILCRIKPERSTTVCPVVPGNAKAERSAATSLGEIAICDLTAVDSSWQPDRLGPSPRTRRVARTPARSASASVDLTSTGLLARAAEKRPSRRLWNGELDRANEWGYPENPDSVHDATDFPLCRWPCLSVDGGADARSEELIRGAEADAKRLREETERRRYAGMPAMGHAPQGSRRSPSRHARSGSRAASRRVAVSRCACWMGRSIVVSPRHVPDEVMPVLCGLLLPWGRSSVLASLAFIR